MSNQSTTSYVNNRRNRFSDQVAYWANRKISGLNRMFERLLVGVNLSDRLGGDGRQIAHLTEILNQVEQIDLKEFSLNGENFNVSLIELKNVMVDINSGLIKLDNGYILDAYLPHWQNLIYAGGLGSEYRRLKQSVPITQGLWTSMSDTPYFYHFVIEDLARVRALISKYPNMKIAITANSSKWKFELLKYFDLPFFAYETSNNRFESYVTRSGGEHKNIDGIKLLKNDVELKNPKESEIELKILITRKGLARENSELDSQLLTELCKIGFTEIQPEKLSISEQIDLFSRASTVVGIHGGSLTNLMWCSKGTKVIEIFGHSYRTSDFQKLANQLELDYKSLSGTPMEIKDKLQLELSA